MKKTSMFVVAVASSLSLWSAQSVVLPKWVVDTDSIAVKNMKMAITVPVTSATTIAQVKAAIQEEEGIPVDQQNIKIEKPWYLFWSEQIALADDARVKEAMTLYNANKFYVWAKLRPVRPEGKE